jgi:ribonuclease D
MHIHPLITDSATLANLCTRLAQCPFVTVDTEFMRENTYWPDLCLIQIASTEEAAAIDPKARDLDMTPLLELMVNNEDVLKVFHAGGQDLEIVHNLTGKTPHPLFDTQVAAMAMGLGEQIGYSNLVETMLGIKLDKGARFTDWGRRPLDKRQIDYAIGDVTHLAECFRGCWKSCARPAAAPGSTPRWTGSAIRRAMRTCPNSPGRGSGCRAASPRCSVA